MRWMLSTLLVSSQRIRHASPKLFGDGEPKLAFEEFQAIAGVWRTDILFNDGPATRVHLLLAVPEKRGGQFPSGGKVKLMEENLPDDVRFGEEDSWSASRQVRAGLSGDDRLGLSLQLGDLQLEGRGQRGGFRCRAFVGRVVEGGDDPRVVGSFAMRLTLPLKTDAAQLERRYKQRIASLHPPPLFPHNGLIGRWKLLLNIMVSPGSALAAYFPIDIYEDGSWQSVELEQTLAGTWGMYSSADALARTGWAPSVPLIMNQGTGDSVRLTVHRDQCTTTGLGVAGLPINFDFLLLGRPLAGDDMPEVEEDGASGMHQEVVLQTSDGIAAHVEGRLWTEDVAKGSFGVFILHRDFDDDWLDRQQEEEDCEMGDDVACETLNVEDEAKRAWLAKLELELSRKSTWGERDLQK